MSQQTFNFCQRWTRRRDSYRPAGEVIDPSRYGVEVLDERTAKAFVVANHYSGSYPAARCRVGLYRMRELVGVAVFSVPSHQTVIPKWTGQEPNAGVELGRFVLLDDVPGNGESFFLSRAFDVLTSEKPDVRAVLSYSDPVPRERADGRVVKPGHYGTIYQATNARYVGRSKARTRLLDPEGLEVSPRALSKLKNGERGAEAVERRLAELGVRRRRGESPEALVQRVRTGELFRPVRHPGNHAYVFAVGEAKRRTRRAFPDGLSYPKAG